MGLLSALAGGPGRLGGTGGLGVLLPMLMGNQDKSGEQQTPGFAPRLQELMASPSFANNVSMMTTGEPSLGGGYAPQQSMAPPQMPPQPGSSNALQGAFSGNPQFQDQLQSLMQTQGPGAQGQVSFAPPPQQMSPAPNPTQPGRRPFGGSTFNQQSYIGQEPEPGLRGRYFTGRI